MKKYWPYGIYAVIVSAIMLPMYGHGYIFLQDFVATPKISLPTIINGVIPPQYPLTLLRVMLSFIFGSAFTQKIILTLILFFPAVFMYRLSLKFVSRPWAFAAGLMYMLNPWVYERFLSGQWLVLLGYVLFPLVAKIIGKTREEGVAKVRQGSMPSNTRDEGEQGKSSQQLLVPCRYCSLVITYFLPCSTLCYLALLLAIYPILSLHWAYIAYAFLLAYAVVYLLCNGGAWRSWLTKTNLVRLLFALVVIVVVNSFWLYGFFKPHTTYETIASQDFKAFQTAADVRLGVWPNAISLYGFWSSDYVLPKESVALWWAVGAIFALLGALGLLLAIRRKQALLITTGLFGVLGLIFGVGLSSPFSSGLTSWAIAWVPGFKGLRETEKLLGLLAFAYALLVPIAAAAITEWLKENSGKLGRAPQYLFTVLLLALTFLSVYGIFWGFNGQVKPANYPQSWYQAATIINAESKDNKTLVLPWQGYPELSFAGYKHVANPAAGFFGSSVITGKNTDNVFLQENSQQPWDALVFRLVQGVSTVSSELPLLKSEHVGFVLLLKESDFWRYTFASSSPELITVLDTPELTLYKIR